MNTFATIFTSIISSGAVIAALAFALRSLISQYLSKDIERFKAKLQIKAFEHQIRFSQLHEKRADIISKLYSAIVDLHRSVDKFIRFLPSSSNEDNNVNLHKIWESADLFSAVFEKNRIFFSEDICSKIDNLNESLSRPVSEIVIHLEISGEQEWAILGNTWRDAQEKLEKEIPLIKKDLEMEFRKLLGVLQVKEVG